MIFAPYRIIQIIKWSRIVKNEQDQEKTIEMFKLPVIKSPWSG